MIRGHWSQDHDCVITVVTGHLFLITVALTDLEPPLHALMYERMFQV